MAAAIPIVGAVGAIIDGTQKANALRYNADIMGYEARTASAQGYEAEAQQRRKTAMMEGSQIAAAGQAGAGLWRVDRTGADPECPQCHGRRAGHTLQGCTAEMGIRSAIAKLVR